MINEYNHKIKLTELSNKLFMFTDNRDWQKLQDEVFTKMVDFDMSSAGGDPRKKISAAEICDKWDKGLKDIDHLHHHAGQYLITIIDDKKAEVYAYATATHFRKTAAGGKVVSYTGSYNLDAVLAKRKWRICGFTYNQKFIVDFTI